MPRYHNGLRITALSVLLGACATGGATNSLPRWVLQPESVYSSSRYLTAVGEGDTMAAAETHALGRLAGRFKTRVQSTEQLSDRVRETFGKVQEFEKTSGYQSDVRLEIDQTLLNVKTAEQFRDAHGRMYVLILIDRLETAGLYEQAIADNARRIIHLVEEDPSKLRSYAKSQQALKLGLTNQMLVAQLAVIHPMSADRIDLPYELELVRMQAAQATTAIHFDVSLQGQQSKSLEQQIRAWMTARGFTAHSDCDLCISGTLAIESADFLREDISTVRYRVLVNIKDKNAQTLLALQKEGRESHMTEDQAIRRAERTVGQMVEEELLKRMEMLVENLAGKP